jgi:alanine-glyoxylate transaminase/serine-glyoxylate transaminase/serine-pyruvate transaminase
MSPLAISPRALDRIETRTRPVPFSLDLRLLRAYFVDRPATYHHTAPILHLYALHEVLRRTLEEGVEARWARHDAAGRHFAASVEEAGFEVLAEDGHRLAPLTAVRVPDGVDGKDVQRQLLAKHGLEIGGGLGAATPPIWRVGLMGPNASEATADQVLAALTGVLEGERVAVAG